MTFRGRLTNSDNSQVSDGRRAKAINRHCIDCDILILRGLRCGPCRDVADEKRRRNAYLQSKQKSVEQQMREHDIFEGL